jgi:peptidoglycan L-alanyl-D-glutamate endopeptidase CwlK
MANYGVKSQTALNTCATDLITVFDEVVLYFDNMIIYGNRSQGDQFELYKQGRSFINGEWVITDKSRVVTYKDGWSKPSKHNLVPSEAVDAVPYPVRWKDTDRMYYFAGFVLGIAARLKAEGKITHDIRYGGDWNRDTNVMDETFMDLVHFEIVN